MEIAAIETVEITKNKQNIFAMGLNKSVVRLQIK